MINLDRKKILEIIILLTVVSFLSFSAVMFFFRGDISVDQMENRKIFGATYMTMSNPFYQVLDSKLRENIEKHGDILLSRDAAMSQQCQNEEIEELISLGAEVIFLTPVEWDQATEALEAARLAQVAVIVVDSPVSDDTLVDCSVISDNYDAGVKCAKHLIKERKSAKIILLEHTTARSGAERIQGFKDTIAAHDGFEVVGEGESDGQIENAMPVMEKLIEESPEADVVMALNDPSAFGAMAAIEGSTKRDDFYVYGVDGSPEAKGLIKDGVMTATCAQFPYIMADTAVKQAYRRLQGKDIEDKIIIPVELITRKNVEEYDNGGWQ